MEKLNVFEVIAFVCGLLGFGGLDGAVYNGEGLMFSLILLAICGLLFYLGKIWNDKKRK